MGAYKGSSHGMTIVFGRFFNWSKAWFANSPMRVWPVDDVDEAVVSEGRTDKLSFDRSCHLFLKPFNSVSHFNRFEGFSSTSTSSPSSGKSSDSKEHSSSSVPKCLRPSGGFEASLFSTLQNSRVLIESWSMKRVHHTHNSNSKKCTKQGQKLRSFRPVCRCGPTYNARKTMT